MKCCRWQAQARRLRSARETGPFAAFSDLWIKDEACNPTASFKARGMAAAITRAAALGVRTVALPSAGNAGGAAAFYAARAGMECHVFMPADTPQANITEAVTAGAHVYLVDGLINDCGKLARQACDEFGWFDLSTLKEPFRIEGKKTMGYELAFDLATADGTAELKLPDVIFYPTGGGTGLIGMWKAFDEMQQLGWIGAERPRMVVVQAEHCCPIVRAFRQEADFAELFEDARTCAMLTAARELAEHQGVCAAPEGGAVWAAARQLADKGWLDPDNRVVLFNTGSGLKYDHLFKPVGLPRLKRDATDWFGQLSQ